MRKYLLISALAVLTMSACHTAYNAGGRNWVKSTPTAQSPVKHNAAKTIAVNTVTTTPVAQTEDNTSASIGETTPVVTTRILNTPTAMATPSTNQNSVSVKMQKTVNAAPAPYGNVICSQRTALWLAIPWALFGLDRFYLHYYFIGIIQLLTLGGFGIWAIIDIYNILTGNLLPKNHVGYRRSRYS